MNRKQTMRASAERNIKLIVEVLRNNKHSAMTRTSWGKRLAGSGVMYAQLLPNHLVEKRLLVRIQTSRIKREVYAPARYIMMTEDMWLEIARKVSKAKIPAVTIANTAGHQARNKEDAKSVYSQRIYDKANKIEADRDKRLMTFEEWLTEKIQLEEKMGSYQIATDTVRVWIEDYAEWLKYSTKSYDIDEVREMALELRNASMYAHSHKLTRFELQKKLTAIENKYKIHYNYSSCAAKRTQNNEQKTETKTI